MTQQKSRNIIKYSNNMVQTSSIRDKLRSNVLKELARERSNKKLKLDDNKERTNELETHDEDSDDQEVESTRLDIERRMAKTRHSNSGLLSILPRPKNASSFGPTINLDRLLKLEEQTSEQDSVQVRSESPVSRLAEDGMMEVDVSKEICDVTPIAVKDLTIEKSKPGVVIVPKGKEKQKNQITYLAQLGKATELEQKQRAAQGRANKAAARSKYGW